MVNFSEFCEVLDVKSDYGYFIEEYGVYIPFEYNNQDLDINEARRLITIESSFYDTDIGIKFESILEKYLTCHDKFMQTRQ